MASSRTVTDATGTHEILPVRPICTHCRKEIRKPRDQKRCPKCGVTRPRSAFSHSSARADHLDSTCRPCVNSMPRSAAVGEVQPQNPIEQGVILGHLQEHQAGWGNGRRGGYSTMELRDAVVVDHRGGEQTPRDEVWVYHSAGIGFRFRRGDRVALAIGLGFVGKVLHIPSGKVVWQDGFMTTTRFNMAELLALWFPEWPGLPPDADPWAYAGYRVPCPFGPHIDRKARVSADGIYCSRHTTNTPREDGSTEDWWTPLDVMVRRRGVADRESAIAELSHLETERLLTLAAKAWAT